MDEGPILSREPILTFFDVKKPVCVSVDASKCGLDERPIAYASRSLTETEKRYAQIKKELLAVRYIRFREISLVYLWCQCHC